MARSGGAQGTWWRGTSIASATCTVAATVQESMWKSPHPPPLLLLGLLSKPLAAPLIIIIIIFLLQLLLLLHPLLKWLTPLLLLFPRLRLPLIFFSSIKGNPLLRMNLAKMVYDFDLINVNSGYVRFLITLLDFDHFDKSSFYFGGWGVGCSDFR